MIADPPEWLDELRLEPGPPFQTMGTHALDLRDWFRIDERSDEEIEQKRVLLERTPEIVMAVDDASAEACVEVRDLVAGWTGASPDLARHALAAAALLVPDDLLILQQIDGEWILTAGVLCFPTHWTVGEKVGLPLAQIHAPVAHYERELRERVDRLHDRLAVDRPVWRRNWFVSPTSERHLPRSSSELRIPDRVDGDGSPLWIRSERQTLRRLPETGAILFTIRVQVAPLGVLRLRPDLAARMLAAVRSWDEPKRGYTSTGRFIDLLEGWLESVVRAG